MSETKKQPEWTLDEVEFHDIHAAYIAPDCTICDYEFPKAQR